MKIHNKLSLKNYMTNTWK